MKKKIRNLLPALILMPTIFCGQMRSYEYAQEILGIKDQWHKIVVPEDVFGKVSQDLSDIRIYGITADQDTIEAPYLLTVASRNRALLPIPVKKLNKVRNEKGYFYTFENIKMLQVNTMQLDFSTKNFDWKLRLEGSHDQKEWYIITDNYRILSFLNQEVDYEYTKISFDDTKYRYYRILIPSREDPKLTEASVYSEVLTGEGSYIDYFNNQYIQEKKKERKTKLIVDLEKPSRISCVHIKPKDTFDYIRPVTIEYLSDSIKTEKGWKYTYKNLLNGTLSSMEANEFLFPAITAGKIRVTVYNGDNEPLRFGDSKVQGFKHELKVRFSKPAHYFFTYGNSTARKPNYDIKKFSSTIPVDLTMLSLGNLQQLEKEKLPATAPLFENKLWLWIIMGLIILILGGFSIKMMSQKKIE